MTDPRDILHLLYRAARERRHPSAVLSEELAADRESVARLTELFEHGNLRPKQAEFRRRGLQRTQESIARQEALLDAFASLREPGALPPVHKSEKPCEAEIAAWAERLQGEVEERVWEFLSEGKVE